MSERVALSDGYKLTVIGQDKKSQVEIQILGVIGMGGNCIVYKGLKNTIINGKDVYSSVIVKEFYPVSLQIDRQDDMSLKIEDQEAFNKLLDNFAQGQIKHMGFYEDFPEQSLPRLFFYGDANNTAYVISDFGMGMSLADIKHKDVTINRAASIMESVCIAIAKIHVQNKVYLDIKPQNFFCHWDEITSLFTVQMFDFDTAITIKEIRSGKYTFCSASLAWIPEEQEPDNGRYKNPGQIGYWTDAYSLGALFFWLLTGNPPTQKDIERIKNKMFDWQKESDCCSMASSDAIMLIREITEATLESSAELRSKKYNNPYAIKESLLGLFSKLKGLTTTETPGTKPIVDTFREENEKVLKGIDEISKSNRETKNRIDNVQKTVVKAVEDQSLKNQLFGSGKKIAIFLTVIVCIGLIVGLMVFLSGKIFGGNNDKIPNSTSTTISEVPANYKASEIEQGMDDKVLLKLTNANHQYEMGLENWKRLDYVRAERDILNARNEISEEVAQSEIEVAKVNNSLGSLYIDMGKYNEAYDYLNAAFVSFKDQFGEKSVEARAARLSIAQYYYFTGKPEDASREIQYILDSSDVRTDREIITSTDHLMAMIYDSQGKYDEALLLYSNVLDMYKDIAVDGVLNKDIANYANDHKLTQADRDHYTNAIKWVVYAYSNIAKVNIHKEDYDAAIAACDKGLNLCLSNIYIGKRHLTTSKLYMNLAIAQGQKGDFNVALDNIDLAMRIQRNLFDFKDVFPGLVEVYGNYGNLLMAKGDSDGAKKYYLDALALSQSSFGENHPDTADAYDLLGNYYHASDNDEEALKNLSQAIEIRKNVLAENHPVTARIYYDLAVVQTAAGNDIGAKESLEAADRICKSWDIHGTLYDTIKKLQK